MIFRSFLWHIVHSGKTSPRVYRLIILIFPLLFIISFSFASNLDHSYNITYRIPNVESAKEKSHLLDVFYPENSEDCHVIVFLHGGSWHNQDKRMYRYLGKRLAKNGYVAVLPNFRDAPEVQYEGMLHDIALAVTWVQRNITTYNGNPNKIFVSGHSSGGHLAALIALSNQPFQDVNKKNPISGCLLIDAFGIDLYNQFMSVRARTLSRFVGAFGYDTLNWQRATPISYVGLRNIPFGILMGGRTYESIKDASYSLIYKMKKEEIYVELYEFKRRTHVGMIVRMRNRHNKLYAAIDDFVEKSELTISTGLIQ